MKTARQLIILHQLTITAVVNGRNVNEGIASVAMDDHQLIVTSYMSSIHKIIHKLSASWQEAKGFAVRGGA